jgi:hypothetical protein
MAPTDDGTKEAGPTPKPTESSTKALLFRFPRAQTATEQTIHPLISPKNPFFCTAVYTQRASEVLLPRNAGRPSAGMSLAITLGVLIGHCN